MMKYILIVLLTALSPDAFCQRAGLMAGGGATWYYGEMNDRVIAHQDLIRSYFSAGIIYRLSNRIDLWAAYLQGKVAGADSLAIRYTIRGRNLSYETKIQQAGIYIGFRLISDEMQTIPVVPYIFTGISGYHFRPRTKLNGQWYDLQSLGTEGQYIKEGDYPEPYELYQLSVPLGAGVEIRLSKALRLRLEAANHFLFTDYFDDVSGAYPDSAALAATPNGALAVLLSNRFTDGIYRAKGIPRGNPKSNDSFVHAGAMLLWTPHFPGRNSAVAKRKNGKHLCPAYH